MKKITLTTLSAMLCFSGAFAQTSPTFDAQNARDGESVEYCLQHKKRAEMLQIPGFAEQEALDEIIRAQEAAQQAANGTPEATTYYVPVVFHVLHNNGSENISDEQILDAFEILNRDYDLQNADANNVVTAFNASNGAATATPFDTDIEFVMATKAPDGTCFSGITRTVSSATSSGDGQGQYLAIRNGNNVYQGEWAGNKYLNIFICADIGGAAGYTFTPSNWVGSGMDNGIWVLDSYVGSIGTSSAGSSRTLTHECGHWLNLPHVWGGTNNPGLASNCNDDDGVDDTPECQGLTACVLAANTCNGDNSYWGFDQIDNTENYMDYSYCSKMFTPGQGQRMRNALNSGVGGRSNIKSVGNLAATGADGNTYLCKAEFSADKITVCAGETVNFNDNSYNAVNGWTWTFTGGTPSSSTSQNPSIQYDTPGLYEVVLDATDGSVTDGETKTGYIRVLPATGTWIPFLEDFESLTTLDGVQWEVRDYGNNAEFELETNAGHTGSKSAKLPNYAESAGNFDELISAPVDLSSITSQTAMTLSFRYAYRKRNSNNDEWLKVYASNNCGDSWAPRKTLHGDLLGSTVSTSSWTPGSVADWTTVHMTNITSAYWVDNFIYKFEFESDGGNNFYLDNINIYAGGANNDLVVGLEDQETFTELTLFPNPVEDEVNVRFNVNNAQNVDFYIQDISGKMIKSHTVQAAVGSNLVVLGTDELASGMYFLNISSGESQQAIQFVVK
ncbi:MAG: PKD repeat protein [Crocinitomicaceae bacterium]|jgi:PKD repeat protein